MPIDRLEVPVFNRRRPVQFTALLALAVSLGLSANAQITVRVAASGSSLTAGGTLQLLPVVTGTSQASVTWSLSAPLGSISSTGLYTAPATVPSVRTVVVTARSVADPTKFGTRTLSIYPELTLTLAPRIATLSAAQQLQFTASVTGNTDTRVGWALSGGGGGSLSVTGLYTAPSTITSPQTITVMARSIANPLRIATATINLTVPVPTNVTISPTTATLLPSQTQTLAVSITGASSTPPINWSMSPAVGLLAPNGTTAVYTAPSAVSAEQTVDIIARSAQDSTRFATTRITLRPPVTVSLSQTSATLNASQTQALTATVTGSTNTNVTWSMSPAVGTISTSGNKAVYTAPSVLETPQTVEVVATSMAMSSATAKVILTLVPVVSVTVTPPTTTLKAGQSQQFTASVAGTANKAVNWSLSSATGTITAAGLYQAPPVTARQTVRVRATSVSNTSKHADSDVEILPDTKVEFTIDANRLTSLSYGGQSFFRYVDSVVQGATFRTPSGSTIVTGWSKPSTAVLRDNPLRYELVYNLGQRNQFTVSVSWTTTDDRTLQATARVQNNDPENTLIALGLYLMSFKLPSPAQQYNRNMPVEVNQYSGNPVAFWSGSWGSVATWHSAIGTPLSTVSYYDSADQVEFRNFISTRTEYGPRRYSLEIAPGATAAFSQTLRFGTSSHTALTLAPEAYESFRTAFPKLLDWADRRPIAYWMTSEGTLRSATNPRGYWRDQSLNAANQTDFRSRTLMETDRTLAVMNGMTVRPQGIIVWDLEGQEFDHAFTYVGYPNKLRELAPEMDRVADEVFGRIRAAGYRVGVTIRPNSFAVGNELPNTCAGNANYGLTDKFILLTAAYPYRGRSCTEWNTWDGSRANRPSAQKTTQGYDEALDLLRQKVRYARDRWGASLFYIDSNVWEGGTPIDMSIIRQLAREFPDCLLIPEMENRTYYGAAAPYNQANQGYWGTSRATRELYPDAFSVINISDAPWRDNEDRIVQAVRAGDILLFRGWFNAPDVQAVQEIYSLAGVR